LPPRYALNATWYKPYKERINALFQGKKVIVFGQRDGVPGPAIAACMKAAGAEVILTVTDCFV